MAPPHEGVRVFRPLICLAAAGCAIGVAGCDSGTSHPSEHQAGGSPGASSAAAPARSPAGPCPSAEEFVAAMNAKGWTGFEVAGRIVCDGGWAATTVNMKKVASDPARAVLHYSGGKWHGISYGTDGLCAAPGMHAVPAAIKTALAPYC